MFEVVDVNVTFQVQFASAFSVIHENQENRKIGKFLKIFTNSNTNQKKLKPVDRYLKSAKIHVIILLKRRFCDLFE